MKNKNIETELKNIKLDIEAKAMGCQITDYEVYRYYERNSSIFTLMTIILLMLLMYLTGYIAGLHTLMLQ